MGALDKESEKKGSYLRRNLEKLGGRVPHLAHDIVDIADILLHAVIVMAHAIHKLQRIPHLAEIKPLPLREYHGVFGKVSIVGIVE